MDRILVLITSWLTRALPKKRSNFTQVWAPVTAPGRMLWSEIIHALLCNSRSNKDVEDAVNTFFNFSGWRGCIKQSASHGNVNIPIKSIESSIQFIKDQSKVPFKSSNDISKQLNVPIYKVPIGSFIKSYKIGQLSYNITPVLVAIPCALSVKAEAL